MRNIVRTTLVLAGALALAAPSPVSAASAAVPPPYLADATDPAVYTLAQDLGISIAEARGRIGWQEPATRMGDELSTSLGESFGGLWFDEAGGGRVKVGIVTGSKSEALARQTIRQWRLEAVTDLIPTQHSSAQLDRDATWLGSLVENSGGQLSSATQVSRNRLVLRVSGTSAMTAAQQAMVEAARARLGSRLVIEAGPTGVQPQDCAWRNGFNCDAPIRGGVKTYINGDTPWCTAAFSARSRSDGAWYIMTAGHCGSIGTEMRAYQPVTGHHHVIGDVHNRDFAGNNDFAIIRVNRPGADGWDVRNWVYVHPTGDTDYNPRYPITGVSTTPEGARVCISGATSGTDCGSVRDLNWNGSGGLARAAYCSDGGDSGAPIYSGNKARGIHVGVVAGHDGDCFNALFQGITEAANALRVNVYTG